MGKSGLTRIFDVVSYCFSYDFRVYYGELKKKPVRNDYAYIIYQ